MRNFIKVFLSNLFFMVICTAISAGIMGFIAGWAFAGVVWPFFAVFFASMLSFGE